MKPVLQALLLADHVYQDAATGKKVIAGTFNQLRFFKKQRPGSPEDVESAGAQQQVFGGVHSGSPYVYISLTDIRGSVSCVLRYVDLEDNKALLETEFSITCGDPLETREIIVPMPPLPAGKAGIHALELLCDDAPVGSLRITVVEINDINHGNS